MANEFFDSGANRAAKVDALFSRIARRYDLINDIQSFGLHRWWKRNLVAAGNPRPGVRALDVCCGTGDIAFSLSRKGAEVVGLDFNSNMLEIAAARNRTLGEPVEFMQGDAQKLPFQDSMFDIVTVGYGLRNLADWRLGLREMLRVTKPAGIVLVLDFGKPDNVVWRTLYFSYLRLFVPLLGLLFCRSATAYSYILESLIHYPAQRGVQDEMLKLGFEEVRVRNCMGGVMSINSGRRRQGPL